jgi:hypothetical protein
MHIQTQYNVAVPLKYLMMRKRRTLRYLSPKVT